MVMRMMNLDDGRPQQWPLPVKATDLSSRLALSGADSFFKANILWDKWLGKAPMYDRITSWRLGSLQVKTFKEVAGQLVAIVSAFGAS